MYCREILCWQVVLLEVFAVVCLFQAATFLHHPSKTGQRRENEETERLLCLGGRHELIVRGSVVISTENNVVRRDLT